MEFIVTAEYDKKLLRDFLFRGLALSRAIVSDLKNKDGIRVNGAHATARYQLAKNDLVALDIEDGEEDTDKSLTPSNIPLDILYEDEYILAINKPPYMPTHLSCRHREDTLANALKYEFDKRGKLFVMRAVNRLDADTSGVVIVAKNRYAADRFAKTNGEIRYEKIYTAICHGHLVGEGEIKGYIRRLRDSIITRGVFKEGKESEFAHTIYRSLETFGNFSLVSCQPITGRTHQLRVHLASIGHPIVGDDMYGGEKILPRQALHAGVLRFTHPFTKKRLEIFAPLPSDMEGFLNENKD